MIPQEMIRFIDPVGDSGKDDKRILVNAVYRRSTSELDTIMEVSGSTMEYSRLYRIAAGGNWVMGPAVNPAVVRNVEVIVLLEDGVYGYGSTLGVVGANSDEVLVRVERRSDRKAFPGGLASASVYVKTWFLAGSWTSETFPLATDTQLAADLKLLRADLLRKRRFVIHQLQIEADHRDWRNNLDEMEEKGHPMGTPNYGVWVTGQLVLPSEERVDPTSAGALAAQFGVPSQRVRAATVVDKGFALVTTMGVDDKDEYVPNTSEVNRRVNEIHYGATFALRSAAPYLRALTTS